jgi:hypothetical protein
MSSINNSMLQEEMSQGSTPGGGEEQVVQETTTLTNKEVLNEGGTIKDAVEGSSQTGKEAPNVAVTSAIAVQELLIEATINGIDNAPAIASEAATLGSLDSILKDTFEVAIEEVLKEFKHRREALEQHLWTLSRRTFFPIIEDQFQSFQTLTGALQAHIYLLYS